MPRDAMASPDQAFAVGGVRVAITLASAGRPGLAATLRSLDALDLDGLDARVVVADDGPPGAVAGIVAARGRGRLLVGIVPSGGGNVARARNAALAAAGGADYAAFLDDDERAEPTWLRALVEAAERHAADAVIGAVRPDYAAGAPARVRRSGLYARHPGPEGTRLTRGGTCNALLRVAAARRLGLAFREEFGRTGGEDTDFFDRLARAGGRIVAAPGAIVAETVPLDRLDPAYLRARHRRHGHTAAAVDLRGRGAAGRGRVYARAALRLAACHLGAGVLDALRHERPRALALGLARRAWEAEGAMLHGLGRAPPALYGAAPLGRAPTGAGDAAAGGAGIALASA